MAASRRDYLQAYFSQATSPRPILTSLNGDNSWLISFPRSRNSLATSDKAYYHVVFEPWLRGASTVLGAWFVHITLSAAPLVADVEAIEDVIRDIEQAATGHSSNDAFEDGNTDQEVYEGAVDAILLGLHLSDHTHPPTLLTFDPRIPVIATPEASKIVSGLSHFHTIVLIRDFPSTATSWDSPDLHPGSPCPDWLTPLRLPGHHELNFCNAIIWTHSNDISKNHEVMLISPHGTRLDEGPLGAFIKSEPKTEKLCLLHGLKENYTARWQTTLGAKGGLALYRRVGGVRYWIPHHSSTLRYNGLLMWGLWTNDVTKTMEWAIEEECKNGGLYNTKPHVVAVDNGDSFVLK